MNKKVKLVVVSLGAGCFMLPGLVGNSVYCIKQVEEVPLKAEAFNNSFSEGLVNSSELKETLKLSARSSILVDGATGEIIYGDNIHEKLPMASMTKLMTMLLVMEKVERGEISLSDKIIVSEYAASQEGSECILEPHGEYAVEELLKSVAVASANDSAVALAELVSGSEEVFAGLMNKRAKELGMLNTNYVNATGLDAPNHYSTAHDLTIVIKELSKHKKVSELGKTWMYDMVHPGGRITSLTNTNRLVRTDGNLCLAKTGHTDNAGYCITTLSKSGGQELIACVMGVKESKLRFEEVKKLNAYGFANFETRQIVSSSVPVGTISVKGGKENLVQVYPAKDVWKLVKKGEEVVIATEPVVEKVVTAPIKGGTVVGSLKVMAGNSEESVDIVIREDLEKITIKEITKKILENS